MIQLTAEPAAGQRFEQQVDGLAKLHKLQVTLVNRQNRFQLLRVPDDANRDPFLQKSKQILRFQRGSLPASQLGLVGISRRYARRSEHATGDGGSQYKPFGGTLLSLNLVMECGQRLLCFSQLSGGRFIVEGTLQQAAITRTQLFLLGSQPHQFQANLDIIE